MEINFTYLIEIVYHAPRIAQTMRHELMSSLARSYQFIKNLATRKKHFSYERPTTLEKYCTSNSKKMGI